VSHKPQAHSPETRFLRYPSELWDSPHLPPILHSAEPRAGFRPPLPCQLSIVYCLLPTVYCLLAAHLVTTAFFTSRNPGGRVGGRRCQTFPKGRSGLLLDE